MNKLLADLRATSKSSEKIKLLQEFSNQDILKKVLEYTYDQVTYVFGIKKIPENKGSIFGLDAQKLELDNLISLLDRLVDRTYTGNAAIEYLEYVLNSAKVSGYYDLMKCIVGRDLNAGINEAIVEKLFPGTIKKPKVQLISAFDQDKINKKIKFPALAQLKVDGARAILIKEGNSVKILTRSGNEYSGLEHIKKVVLNNNKDFVLDGEIIYNKDKSNKNVFETTPEDRQFSNGIVNKSIQGTISAHEANDLQYVVWDCIMLDEYKKENKSTLYFERFKKDLDSVIDNHHIIKVENSEVNNLQEAKDLYKKYRQHGYEGIILKNKVMFWENKRSQDAFKFKDEFDVDLVITGFDLHAKDSTKLGAIICESSDGKIKVRVGSGFKDSNDSKSLIDRTGALVAANNGTLIGRIVTVRCNSVIKSKSKEEYSLFLPRLICYREDKSDANSLSDLGIE